MYRCCIRFSRYSGSWPRMASATLVIRRLMITINMLMTPCRSAWSPQASLGEKSIKITSKNNGHDSLFYCPKRDDAPAVYFTRLFFSSSLRKSQISERPRLRLLAADKGSFTLSRVQGNKFFNDVRPQRWHWTSRTPGNAWISEKKTEKTRIAANIREPITVVISPRYGGSEWKKIYKKINTAQRKANARNNRHSVKTLRAMTGANSAWQPDRPALNCAKFSHGYR